MVGGKEKGAVKKKNSHGFPFPCRQGRLKGDKVLIEQACNHYTLHTGKSASPDDDEDFLHRITVNFLRHECSHYDHELDRLYGKVGHDDAYLLLSGRIFNEIAKQYDWLAQECHRQSKNRSDNIGYKQAMM